MAASQTPATFKGIVKQVLSGDAVLIRGQPKGGPPPVRQINFSNVVAPRMARRGTATLPETPDEPFAWESREYLRKKVVGKEVVFTSETKTNTGREYGTVYVGKDLATGENLSDTMIGEGLLTVRRESIRGESNLAELEDQAKSQSKGKWAGTEADHVRDVKWSVDNLRSFVDKAGGEPIMAVIEHVRDGSTVRAFLLPDFNYITLMISGIRCPMVKLDSDGKPDKNNVEPFAEEARYYVESRLLQRDVSIILETHSNNNFVGSIVHPNGNIAEALLREGFAKCVDWSMATVTGGPEKLRAAEKFAKEKQSRVWADYKPSTLQISENEKEFTGKVMEVVSGDALIIKRQDNTLKKIFLASIRPPRLQDDGSRSSSNTFRPLYDVPWLFEAREFLRKKLIGQTVQVTVDYIQPAQNNFPEKICCTVRIGDINVADAMVVKGIATVVRYRQDDDQRASCYDDLLSAEAKAIKGMKGLHNKKETPLHKVADISSDVAKARGFLPFLQRAGKVEAVVEFVAAGSRMRLFIPRETCLVTFLLAGISCPKAGRPAPRGSGIMIPGEPYGSEAHEFTKSLIMQREVQIEVDSMDKGGNFIGWLHIDGKNLSALLVEEGLGKVHITAESSRFYGKLCQVEASAKEAMKNLWSSYSKEEEEKEDKVEEQVTERKVDHKNMVISEITRDARIFGQFCSDGPPLEKMMGELRKEFSNNPPLAGAYTPKRGDVCACKFGDGCWYRAKVEKFSGGKVHMLYIDYGNREVTTPVSCATLPASFTGIHGYAYEMQLALVKYHKDEDNLADAVSMLLSEVREKEVLVNKEYRSGGVDFVTMLRSDTKADLANTLISQGLALLDYKKDKRFQGLVTDYRSAQEEAKKNHLNIWQYGDITDDDAFEFGMER